MGKLLIDERPLTVLPSLVAAVGMERAVILQQIHWLLQGRNNGIEHDGERWVWGTYDEWCADYFPFWKADTLRKHLVKLEKDGYVISAQIKGFDRTKHYRINPKKIAEIESPMRHDHATSKRKEIKPTNCDDHAASMRDDDAISKRDDHASSYTTKTSTETSKNKEDDDLPLLPLVVDSARDAVHAAWLNIYGDTMPANLITLIDGLTVECGKEATIYAIRTSHDNDGRTFSYIAKCARNYIPPAPQPPPPTYALELPGVHRFEPPIVAPAAAPPSRPAPLAHDNPWVVGVAELCSEHPRFADWLPGSTLTATDAVSDGKPVYRLRVADARGVQWLESMSAAVCRKVGSLLGKRVLIEIVAGEGESEVVT